jgi:putative tryptophan/tyrosine transport system substrate-binding protein
MADEAKAAELQKKALTVLSDLGFDEAELAQYRWAEGRTERFDEIAAEFVRRKVDVIVTSATASVVAAMQATSL